MAGTPTNQDIYSRVFGSGEMVQTSAAELFLNKTPELEEIAQKVMRDVENSEGPYRAWEGPAREDYRYYHGHQWDDVDRMRMEQLKRPALTFNEIKPVVNAVSGLVRLNATEVRFVTRAMDSPMQMDMAGDLATEAVIAADDMCNGVPEECNLAKTVSVTGMGWGEVKMDYNIDVNGRSVFEEFDCFEARWPGNCHRPNLEGSDWRARKRSVSRKEFEKLWPGMLDKVDTAVPEMPYGQTQKYELVTPYYSLANEKANPQVGTQTQLKKTVEVIHYQWREMQPIYRFQDPDSGEITTFNDDKWDRLSKRMELLGGSPPPAVKQMQPVYRQVYVSRGVVLEDPVDLPNGFSLLCMTGEWDGVKKRFVGIVRDMIDPNKTENKAISSALGFHITNAKGGTMFKSSAFADPDHAKDQWSRADAWIEVSDEANIQTDIVQREPAKMSPDLGMFYQEGRRAISRVTGINEETVGIASSQTPSQTARGRQQAGLIVLGWYWDNLQRFKRERAKTMLDFIREFWSQGQLIQVGGDFNSQAIPLIKDSLPIDYTMVLDDSIRHNPDLKASLWHEMMESGAMQWFLKAGMGSVILALLKYSPWPSYVVRTIQQTVMQNPPQQQQQKGRGKQEPPEMTAAKVRHTDAQTQKALAQARSIDMQTKTDPNFKIAELAAQTALKAHELRMKKEDQASRMAQMARQVGFGGPE